MSHCYEDLSEEDLFQLVKKGDHQAFACLYKAYVMPLTSYASKKLTVELAADCVHDVFSNLWLKRDSIRIQLRFSSYIYGALKNRIYDQLMNSNNAIFYIDHLDDLFDLYTKNTTDYKARLYFLNQTVKEVLDGFGKDAYLLFKLYLKGYKNEEIAFRLGIAEKTVRNKKAMILKFLKEGLLKRGFRRRKF